MRQTRRPDLPHADLTDRILAGFFETYGELGHGFSDQVLCRALAIVLRMAGLSVLEEAHLDVWFRGQCIGRFRADLIVDRTILIEVKGMAELKSHAEAQLINYLKAAGGGVGLLLNFGHEPKFKRMVVGDPLNSLPVLRQPATAPAER